MEIIDATTARRELRTLLDRAQIHGQPTAITRHGEVIAVVVPADWVNVPDLPEVGAAGITAAHNGAGPVPR